MATPSGVVDVLRASRPALKSPHERVAFSIHATFLAAGYSLTGAGPKTRLGVLIDPEEEDDSIEGWNHGGDVFTFRYSGAGGPDLPRSVVIRMMSIDDKLMVDATPLTETDDMGLPQGPFHLSIKVSDYAMETDAPNYEDQFADLEGLVKLVNQRILSKLSKPRGPFANAGEAYSTEGWKPPWAEPWGPQHPPTGYVVPPLPAYGGSDVFPEAGVGVFPRRHPRGNDGWMFMGPNDPRWGRPRFDVQDIPGEPPLIVSGVGRFDPILPFAGTGFDLPRYPPGAPHPDVEPFYPP